MPDQTSTAALFPFMPTPDAPHPLSAGYRKFNGQLLHFMARRLRAQAAFVEGLADCDGPVDLFRRQMEFVQPAWKEYADESSQAWSSTIVSGR